MSDGARVFVLDGLGTPGQVGSGYYTGRLPDGRGALCRYGDGGIEVVWFDPAGNLLDAENVALPEVVTRVEDDPYKYMAQTLRAWWDRASLAAAPLEVHWFDVAEPFSVTVDLLPGGLYEFANNPDSYPPEEREEMAPRLAEWTASGGYVLLWGQQQFVRTRNGHAAY